LREELTSLSNPDLEIRGEQFGPKVMVGEGVPPPGPLPWIRHCNHTYV